MYTRQQVLNLWARSIKYLMNLSSWHHNNNLGQQYNSWKRAAAPVVTSISKISTSLSNFDMKIIVMAILLLGINLTHATCEYECSMHTPCSIKITPETIHARGPHGAFYVPKCRPCNEVCRETNGYVGGMEWNAWWQETHNCINHHPFNCQIKTLFALSS